VQKGYVPDLHEAAVMYVAKMKIGAHKTQITMDGLKLESSRCNCNAQRTRFCEHSLIQFITYIRQKSLIIQT